MTEKEKLEQLVKECNSFREILEKQGKAISGDSVKLLKNKLDLYKISYLFIKEKEVKKQVPLQEILVENSNYKSSDLKKRLIKEGLKKDICEICGCTNIWNNNPLTLQLDHINGNHHDNRIENLRIICPNCHSQTDNYCGNANKDKTIYYCKDCGKEITKGALYCSICASKHRRKVNRPEKEKLIKDFIKYKSFVQVAKLYNVSDNAVRKWCKTFDFPTKIKELLEYIQSYNLIQL